MRDGTSHIRARLDFPGASALYVHPRADGVRFAARCDDGPVSMWWHFAVEGPMDSPLQFIWEHTEQVLGEGSLAPVAPVYQADGRWRRAPARWCRHDAERHEFHFDVPVTGERT